MEKDLLDCTVACEDITNKDILEVLNDVWYEVCKLRWLVLVLMFFVIIYYISILWLLYYIFW